MKTMGAILVAATLITGSGCARPDWIEQMLVTVDVTGTWFGDVTVASGHRQLTMELKQEGSKVTGSMTSIWNSGPIEGAVRGDQFEFRRLNGALVAEMTVSGDEMTGRTHGSILDGLISLRRANPSSSPSAPKP